MKFNENTKITRVFNTAVFSKCNICKEPRYIFNADIYFNVMTNDSNDATIPLNLYMNDDGTACSFVYIDCNDLTDEQMCCIDGGHIHYKATVGTFKDAAILNYIYADKYLPLRILDKYHIEKCAVTGIEYTRNGNKFDTTYMIDVSDDVIDGSIPPCENICIILNSMCFDKPTMKYMHTLNSTKPIKFIELFEMNIFTEEEEYNIYNFIEGGK